MIHKMNDVANSLSSNFSSSRQYRKKMNTDSESALKTVLKNGLRIYIFELFFEETNVFLIQEKPHKLCD